MCWAKVFNSQNIISWLSGSLKLEFSLPGLKAGAICRRCAPHAIAFKCP